MLSHFNVLVPTKKSRVEGEGEIYFRFPWVIFWSGQNTTFLFSTVLVISMQGSSTKHGKVNDSGHVGVDIFHPYTLPSKDWFWRHHYLKNREVVIVRKTARKYLVQHSTWLIFTKVPQFLFKASGERQVPTSVRGDIFHLQRALTIKQFLFVLSINPYGLTGNNGPPTSYFQ